MSRLSGSTRFTRPRDPTDKQHAPGGGQISAQQPRTPEQKEISTLGFCVCQVRVLTQSQEVVGAETHSCLLVIVFCSQTNTYIHTRDLYFLVLFSCCPPTFHLRSHYHHSDF